MLMRKAFKDVKPGKINVPAGTELYLALAAVHHDTELGEKMLTNQIQSLKI